MARLRWWILRSCQHDAERAKWLLAGADKAPFHYQQSAGKDGGGLNLWWAKVDPQLSEEMIEEGLWPLELLFIVGLAACQLQPRLLEARAAVGLPHQASTTHDLNGDFPSHPSHNPSSNDDGDNDEQRVGLFEPRYRDLCGMVVLAFGRRCVARAVATYATSNRDAAQTTGQDASGGDEGLLGERRWHAVRLGRKRDAQDDQRQPRRSQIRPSLQGHDRCLGPRAALPAGHKEGRLESFSYAIATLDPLDCVLKRPLLDVLYSFHGNPPKTIREASVA